MPRIPGLDGIRAIAVLLVMLTHAEIVGGAGWVGVMMFFVISGYIITRLLVTERSVTGGVGLRSFYVRRAGRLLPALLLMALVVTILNVLRDYPGSVGFGLASVFYVSSWVEASGVVMPGLGHTWSLSVEEQFYLIWPVILILARPRVALAIAIVVALASAAWRDVLWATGAPWYRFAFGADAEMDGLMVGCAVALIAPTWRPSRLAVIVACFAIVAAIASQEGGIGLQAVVGIPLAIIATVVLIQACAAGDARWLATRPLVAIGLISYGLYVWGNPIFGFGNGVLADVPTWPRFAVLMGVSLLVAAASYRWLEQPIREWARRRSREEASMPATPMPAPVGAVVGD